MITDKQIFQVYEEMEKICYEINDMFVATDQVMGRNGFTTNGNVMRWDASETLGSPTTWLPYFSQRLYYKDSNYKKVLGINLLMKDAELENTIPFLTCGLIISTNDKGIYASDELYGAGWHKDNPSIENIPNTPMLTTKGENRHLLTYFLGLTSIRSLQDLEPLVAEPLVRMYEGINSLENLKDFNGVAEEASKNIKSCALTLSSITQP